MPNPSPAPFGPCHSYIAHAVVHASGMPITKKGAQEEHGRAASIFLFFFFRWPAASLALRSNSVVQITGRIEQTDGRAKGVTCNQGKVRKGGAPRPTDREESESVTRTQTVRGYYRKTFSFIGFLSDGLLFIYFFFRVSFLLHPSVGRCNCEASPAPSAERRKQPSVLVGHYVFPFASFSIAFRPYFLSLVQKRQARAFVTSIQVFRDISRRAAVERRKPCMYSQVLHVV